MKLVVNKEIIEQVRMYAKDQRVINFMGDYFTSIAPITIIVDTLLKRCDKLDKWLETEEK